MMRMVRPSPLQVQQKVAEYEDEPKKPASEIVRYDREFLLTFAEVHNLHIAWLRVASANCCLRIDLEASCRGPTHHQRRLLLQQMQSSSSMT